MSFNTLPLTPSNLEGDFLLSFVSIRTVAVRCIYSAKG